MTAARSERGGARPPERGRLLRELDVAMQEGKGTASSLVCKGMCLRTLLRDIALQKRPAAGTLGAVCLGSVVFKPRGRRARLATVVMRVRLRTAAGLQSQISGSAGPVTSTERSCVRRPSARRCLGTPARSARSFTKPCGAGEEQRNRSRCPLAATPSRCDSLTNTSVAPKEGTRSEFRPTDPLPLEVYCGLVRA